MSVKTSVAGELGQRWPALGALAAAATAGVAAGLLLGWRKGMFASSERLPKNVPTAARTNTIPRLTMDSVAGRQWMQRMQAFIFDIDGVIHKGGKPVPGVPEALTQIRASGKRVLFMTNNATTTPEAVVELFAWFGVKASPEEVMTSSIATAALLESQGLQGSTVYVVGMDALAKTLQQRAGVKTIGAEADSGKARKEVMAELLTLDPPAEEVKAVVVGADYSFNYYKLCRAANYLWQNPECIFVGTNLDPRVPVGNECIGAAGGTMIAAIATASGRQPNIVCGEPSSHLAKWLLENQNLDPATTCMVGDRTDTDIEFGRAGGMQTLFVESGSMTLDEASSAPADSFPHFVAHSVATLGALLRPELL